MGRELQKKKNKSSIPKATLKRKSRKLNIKSNPIIAANWSRHETLSQNYRRLGLTSKLNTRSGGVEPSLKASTLTSNPISDAAPSKSDPLSIANANTTVLVPRTAKIERDPNTGAILRVIQDEKGNKDVEKARRLGRKPLEDPLNDEESGDEISGTRSQHDMHLPTRNASREEGNKDGRIIQELEVQAATTGTKKRPRKQSKREEEWIEQLMGRYGDDVGKMVRDRKLNPMQQSEGDIRKRIRLWKQRRREGDVEEMEEG